MYIQPGIGLLIDFIVFLILFFSFIGGLKEGAVKEFFAVVAFIIALPVSGLFYIYIASWLTFIPDSDWRIILGFFLTMGFILLILHFIFMVPRHLLDKVWNAGIIWSFLGGIFALFNSAMGLVVLITVLQAHPILEWFKDLIAVSGLLSWLMSNLNSIVFLLPEALR